MTYERLTPWEAPDGPVYEELKEPTRLDLLRWKTAELRETWPTKLAMGIAFRLPWRVVYWCIIRAGSGALSDAPTLHPDELKLQDMLGYAAKRERRPRWMGRI